MELIKNIQFSAESEQDAIRRQGYVLRVLLLGSLILVASGLTVLLIAHLRNFTSETSTPLSLIGGVFCLFLSLYILAQTNRVRLASIILISTYFILATYAAYTYGTIFIQAWLMYLLAVSMSFILIGIRAGLISAIITSIALIILDYFQRAGYSFPDMSWTVDFKAGIVTSTFLFMVIASIIWLATREVERSLKRAYASEAALKRERDLLEVKVVERTKELQAAQADRMIQLYRFAAFGRMASGVFHDISNPLTTVSLSLEGMKGRRSSTDNLQLAIEGTERMQRFITAARRQLKDQEQRNLFSLNEEVDHAIDILMYKARKHQVNLLQDVNRGLKTYGNPVKFQQIITNLVANAIDAYQSVKDKSKPRQVHLTITEKNKKIILAVKDNGCGIAKDNLKRIFEPFYTTKGEDGIGIGLSIITEIIEKDFGGTISVKSDQQNGTIFTVTFPQRTHDHD